MKLILFRILMIAALLVSLISAGLTVKPVQAEGTGLYYVVQQDDSLYSISLYFHSTPLRIQLSNYLTDADVITPGMRLLIPGFNDLSGTLTPIKLGIGDTPLSLMRGSRSDDSTFTRINFLTSPDAVFVGQKLFTISNTQPNNLRLPIPGGVTGLEMAAENNVNPWTTAEYNNLPGTWYMIQNDILYLPSANADAAPNLLPGITQVSASELDQGTTATFSLTGSNAAQVKGSIDFSVEDADQEQANFSTATTPNAPYKIVTKDSVYNLNFFPAAANSVSALQGTPRMAVPGTARLTLTSTDAAGHSYSLDQNLLVKAVDYGYDSQMQVASETVDPKVTEPEDEFLFKTTLPVTTTKMWNGAFTPPTATPDCKSDFYGRKRSFNGSPFIYWHSGTDYCGAVGDKVFAAADGIVVFAGPLTVRGNATIIDHGEGIYTAYYHQSEIDVKVGDHVTAGQQIGLIGATGRVTGPHLHFDLLVGDVQVIADDWLNGSIP